jgi:hypothetical protein
MYFFFHCRLVNFCSETFEGKGRHNIFTVLIFSPNLQHCFTCFLAKGTEFQIPSDTDESVLHV